MGVFIARRFPKHALWNDDATALLKPDGSELVVLAVQFAPIATAEIASTSGVTVGESRQISDGQDRGARLIWAVPDGATEPTWCWWLWPQSPYEGA